jgi:hypothetical protein
MIGMVHNTPGQMPNLVNSMPSVPGLPTGMQGSGVSLQGPPGYERAAATGTFWDQVQAKQYELQGGDLGAMVHGQGLGAPLVHGMGLGAPLVHGMGLGEFGVSDADLDKMAVAMAASNSAGTLTGSLVGEAMKGLTTGERTTLGVKLMALGVPPAMVATGKMLGSIKSPAGKKSMMVWGVLGTISMAASAYHGYKRNDSIGWALWWGFMGSLFPVITPVIGVAQGFAKPKGL